MDFFEQQERARRHTARLLTYFACAVVAIVGLTYLIFAPGVLMFVKPPPHARRTLGLVTPFWLFGEAATYPKLFLRWTWEPRLFAGYAVGATLIIAFGSFYKIRQLAAGGPVVAEFLGGRRVEPDTTDADEQKLRNVVEEMALASGMAVPEIYVLDHERGMNSFAAGHSRSDVALGVTRGCLKLMDRDELQGVIAHEFSHILNGDTALNMRLMGVVHGVLWPVILGRILVRGEDRPAYLGESVLDEDSSVTRLPAVVLGLPLMAVGSMALPFVRLIKSAICREREWLADAAAVQFTRYPAGIAGALKKIGGLWKHGQLDTPHAETASHLYFANSTWTPWFNFLSTHPPLENRILAVDPAFDGTFPKVTPLPPSQFERERRYVDAVANIMALDKTHPELLLSTTGNPTGDHVRAAAALRLDLPPAISGACRAPAGAQAILYALLLSDDETSQAGEVQILRDRLEPALVEQTTDLLPIVCDLDPRLKLPLVDLSLPALRHLDADEYARFTQTIQDLVAYDRAIDLFEYTLQKILRQRLQPFYAPASRPGVAYRSVASLVPDCSVLLSALAHVGQDESGRLAAFRRGAAYLDLPLGNRRPQAADASDASAEPKAPAPTGLEPQFLTGEECDLVQVDAALDRVALAAPFVKCNVLLACAQTVAADGRILYREAELLRAIAATLDCPIPPFIEALAAGEET